VQIVGRSQDELGVLRLAHAFAQATGLRSALRPRAILVVRQRLVSPS
jgi:Asp-tRNA(Asn)/Glu-tRNA(Gln) amidotransferase A subunit family amidase